MLNALAEHIKQIMYRQAKESFEKILKLVDKNEEESFLLLSKLYEHMTQEKYIYRHKWKENMLLMWDNRTVMHMAEGGYDGYDRLLHRITIANS